MKLRNLFEDTPRQIFLQFQQLLIDLDDTFEQADPPWVIDEGPNGVDVVRMKFESLGSPNHSVRTIIFTANFKNDQHFDEYAIACYGKTPADKLQATTVSGIAVGRKIFRKYADSLHEVMVYLDRVLKAKT